MRLRFGSIVSLLVVMHASGCNTVDPDECWPNTSGGLGGSEPIPIGKIAPCLLPQESETRRATGLHFSGPAARPC